MRLCSDHDITLVGDTSAEQSVDNIFNFIF